MSDLLRFLVAVLLLGCAGSLPQMSTAQSIESDEINERTENRHVQTSYTPVDLIENSTPAVEQAAVALSYVAGSWSILIRTEASDWSLARAEQVTFQVDDTTYETTDIHTVDADQTPNTTTEENAILAPSELRTLLADAETIEVTIGDYILDLSDLTDHYALMSTRLNDSSDASAQHANGS